MSDNTSSPGVSALPRRHYASGGIEFENRMRALDHYHKEMDAQIQMLTRKMQAKEDNTAKFREVRKKELDRELEQLEDDLARAKVKHQQILTHKLKENRKPNREYQKELINTKLQFVRDLYQFDPRWRDKIRAKKQMELNRLEQKKRQLQVQSDFLDDELDRQLDYQIKNARFDIYKLQKQTQIKLANKYTDQLNDPNHPEKSLLTQLHKEEDKKKQEEHIGESEGDEESEESEEKAKIKQTSKRDSKSDKEESHRTKIRPSIPQDDPEIKEMEEKLNQREKEKDERKAKAKQEKILKEQQEEQERLENERKAKELKRKLEQDKRIEEELELKKKQDKQIAKQKELELKIKQEKDKELKNKQEKEKEEKLKQDREKEKLLKEKEDQLQKEKEMKNKKEAELKLKLGKDLEDSDQNEEAKLVKKSSSRQGIYTPVPAEIRTTTKNEATVPGDFMHDSDESEGESYSEDFSDDMAFVGTHKQGEFKSNNTSMSLEKTQEKPKTVMGGIFKQADAVLHKKPANEVKRNELPIAVADSDIDQSSYEEEEEEDSDIAIKPLK